MTAPLGLLLALTVVTGQPNMIVQGGDPSPGLLVNRTIGQHPLDPPDQSKQTIVFIHGLNPVPGAIRFTMAERLAEAIGRRYGPAAFNVLDWDWNAAAGFGPRIRIRNEVAVQQGRMLAAALARAGIQPEQVHLIGHSAGCIVAASAAGTMGRHSGRRVRHLSLLEPAAYSHDLIFDQLSPVDWSERVENFWSHGPTAFGRPAQSRGVRDIRVDHSTPISGLFLPERSGHIAIVKWYVASVELPHESDGFNTSGLLGR